MVKHIVMYTLKEGVNKAEAVELIRSVLEPLLAGGIAKQEILEVLEELCREEETC